MSLDNPLTRGDGVTPTGNIFNKTDKINQAATQKSQGLDFAIARKKSIMYPDRVPDSINDFLLLNPNASERDIAKYNTTKFRQDVNDADKIKRDELAFALSSGRTTGTTLADSSISLFGKGSLGLGQLAYGSADLASRFNPMTLGDAAQNYIRNGEFDAVNIPSLDEATQALSGEALSQKFNRSRDILNSFQSDRLKAGREDIQIKSQDRDARNANIINEDSPIQDKIFNGIENFVEATGDYIDNPEVAIDATLESLPQMIGPGAISGAITKRISSKLITELGEKEAAQFLASKAGKKLIDKVATQSGIGFTAASEGISNGLQVQGEILSAKHEDLLESSPRYLALIDNGMSQSKAKRALADEAGLVTTGIAGLFGGVTSKFSGAAKFEGKLFKVDSKIGRNIITKVSSAGIRGTLTEGTEETLQGASGQFASNYAKQRTINPNQSLTEGVIDSAAAGLATGALSGGSLGTAAAVPNAAKEAVVQTIDKTLSKKGLTPDVRTALKTGNTETVFAKKDGKYRNAEDAVNVLIETAPKTKNLKSHIYKIRLGIAQIVSENPNAKGEVLTRLDNYLETANALTQQLVAKERPALKEFVQEASDGKLKAGTETSSRIDTTLNSFGNMAITSAPMAAETQKQAETILATGLANETQTKKLEDFVKTLKTYSEVTNDVFNGSEGKFIGINTYRTLITAAVSEKSEEVASVTLGKLSEFANKHAEKLDTLQKAFTAFKKIQGNMTKADLSKSDQAAISKAESRKGLNGKNFIVQGGTGALIQQITQEVEALNAATDGLTNVVATAFNKEKTDSPATVEDASAPAVSTETSSDGNIVQVRKDKKDREIVITSTVTTKDGVTTTKFSGKRDGRKLSSTGLRLNKAELLDKYGLTQESVDIIDDIDSFTVLAHRSEDGTDRGSITVIANTEDGRVELILRVVPKKTKKISSPKNEITISDVLGNLQPGEVPKLSNLTSAERKVVLDLTGGNNQKSVDTWFKASEEQQTIDPEVDTSNDESPFYTDEEIAQNKKDKATPPTAKVADATTEQIEVVESVASKGDTNLSEGESLLKQAQDLGLKIPAAVRNNPNNKKALRILKDKIKTASVTNAPTKKVVTESTKADKPRVDEGTDTPKYNLVDSLLNNATSSETFTNKQGETVNEGNENPLKAAFTKGKQVATNLLQTVPNLFSKIKEDISVLGELNEAQIKSIKSIQDFHDKFKKELITNFKGKGKAFLFQDSMQFLLKKGYDPENITEADLDENLVSTMAMVTLNWLATHSGKTASNNKENINRLLGRDTKSAVSDYEASMLQFTGSLQTAVVRDLGRDIILALGLKAKSDVAGQTQQNIENSLANHALGVLLSIDLVTLSTMKSHVFTGMIDGNTSSAIQGKAQLLELLRQRLTKLRKSGKLTDTTLTEMLTEFLSEFSNSPRNNLAAINTANAALEFSHEIENNTVKSIDRYLANESKAVTGFIRVLTELEDRESATGTKYSVAVPLTNSDKTGPGDLITTIRESDKILEKVFGIEPKETGPTFTQPANTRESVVKKIRNTFLDVPSRIRYRLAKVQRVAYILKPKMLAISDFLGDENSLEIAGLVTDYADTKHESSHKNIEGKNASIFADFRNMKNFYELIGDTTKPFYFTYQVWKSMRMGIDSNTVNPQSSKYHRHMMGIKSHKQVLDTTDNKHMSGFLVAVATSFGIGTDKNDTAGSIEALADLFDESKNADAKTLNDGIQAIQDFNSGNITNKEATQRKIVEAVKVGGEAHYTLDGLIAYADYLTAKETNGKFETDLFREADGITNGVAIGLLQLVMENTDKLISMLQRTGIFTDGTKSFGSWIKDTANLDSYQDMSRLWSQQLTDVRKLIQGTSAVNMYLPNANKRVRNIEYLRNTFSNADTILNPLQALIGAFTEADGKTITALGRKLVKNPLMITNYGAAITKVIEAFSNERLLNIYAEIASHKGTPNEIENITIIVNNLNATQSKFDRNPIDVKDVLANPLSWTMGAYKENQFKLLVESTYGMALEQAIGSLFNDFITQRTELNRAMTISFTAFKLQYDKAYEAAVKEADGNQPSVEVMRKINESLLDAMPMFRAYFSDTNKDGILVMKDTRTPERDNPKFVTETRFNEGFDVVQIDSSGNPELNTNSKGKVLKAVATKPGWKDGGVSGPISGIHNIDAATMLLMLESFEAGNVHDAGIFSILDAEKGGQALNEAFIKVSRDYSIMGEMVTTLNRVVGNLQKSDPELYAQLVSKVSKDFLAGPMDYNTGLPTVTLDGFMASFNKKDRVNKALREQIFNKITDVDQYTLGEGTSITINASTESTKETIEKAVDDIVTDIKPAGKGEFTASTVLNLFDRLNIQIKSIDKTSKFYQGIADTFNILGEMKSLMIKGKSPKEAFNAINFFEKKKDGDKLKQDFLEWLVTHEDKSTTDQTLLNAIRSGDIKTVLKAVVSGDITGTYAPIVKRITKLLPKDLTIKVVNISDINRMSLQKSAKKMLKTSYGMFVLNDNTIYLVDSTMKKSGINSETVLHELLHSVVMQVIFTDVSTLTKDQLKARNELNTLLQLARKHDTKSEYTRELADMHELISWGLTNQKFQNYLKSISTNNISAWNTFTNSLRRLIGLDKTDSNALNNLIQVTDRLITNEQVNSFGSDNSTIDPSNFNATQEYDVTSKTVEQVYDALGKQDPILDSPKHDAHLRTLLRNIVAKAVNPLKVFVEEKGTTNSGLLGDDGSTIYMSNALPNAASALGTRMSQREVYVHELFHNLTYAAIDGNTQAARKLRRFYLDIRDAKNPDGSAWLTPMDFMEVKLSDKDPNYKEEYAAAEARYEYIFGNNISKHTREVYNPLTRKNEKQVLNSGHHEFLTMGATNAAFREKLSTYVPNDNAPRKKIADTESWFDKFNIFIENILNWVNDKITGTYNQNGAEAIINLAGQLAGINTKTKSTLWQQAENTGAIVGKSFDILAKTILYPFNKLLELKSFKNSKSKLGKTVYGVASTIKHLDVYPEVIQTVRDLSGITKESLLSNLVHEMRGAHKDNMYLHDLRRLSNKILDQLRTRVATTISKILKDKYASELSQKTKNAISKSLIKTDIDSLFDEVDGVINYDGDYLYKLLSDKTFVANEKGKIIQELRSLYSKNSNWYVSMALSMGKEMATGRPIEKWSVTNANIIAELDNTSLKPEGDLIKAEQLIDRLATLQAISQTSSHYNDNVAELIKNEFDNDPNENGILFTLALHRESKKSAMDISFNGQKKLFVKGYTKEQFDSNKSFVVAPESHEGELLKQGYTKGKLVRKDVTDPNQEQQFMYISNTTATAKLMAGIMSYTNKKAKGTTILDVYAQLGEVDPGVAARLNRLTIDKRKAAQIKAITEGKSVPLQPTEGVLAPIFNNKGEVVDYRYKMDEITKDEVLKKDNSFDTILGAMEANIVDKANTQFINRKTIKETYAYYLKNNTKNNRGYIEIGPNVKDNKYKEIYRLLPDDAKNDIRDITGGDSMFVKAEEAALIFGIRKISVSQLRKKTRTDATTSKEWLGMQLNNAAAYTLNRKYVRYAENIWQEIIAAVKDAIVIKSGGVLIGNVVSNTILLKTLGVSVKDITFLHGEAFVGVRKHKKDSEELDILRLEDALEPTKKGKHTKRIAELEHEIAINPVTPLINAGMFQSIVEDIDILDDPNSYKSKIEDWIDNNKVTSTVLANTPQSVKTVGKNLVMAHDTSIYKFMRDMTQVSDFVARYTLHQHNLKNGMDAKKSIDMITEVFIDYAPPTHRYLQYANDMGGIMFTKFFFRIQKVLFYLAKERPGSLLASIVGQGLTIELSDISDSNLLTGLSGKFNDITDIFGLPLEILDAPATVVGELLD